MAVHWAAVLAITMLSAACVVVIAALAVSVSSYTTYKTHDAAWQRWQAHLRSPQAAARLRAATRAHDTVRGIVHAVLPDAKVTMFGSQALQYADDTSDTDIKVHVGDANGSHQDTLRQVLLAAGFRQVAATKRYVLFRATLHGMPTDVSVVTTNTPGDSPELLSPVARSLKGFLLWYIRTSGDVPVSVHTYTVKPGSAGT